MLESYILKAFQSFVENRTKDSVDLGFGHEFCTVSIMVVMSVNETYSTIRHLNSSHEMEFIFDELTFRLSESYTSSLKPGLKIYDYNSQKFISTTKNSTSCVRGKMQNSLVLFTPWLTPNDFSCQEETF